MKHFLYAIIAAALFTACNLTKDVDIVLPEYEIQPVVECYLEPGKPFRLLLTRSYSFFDPLGLDTAFINNTFLQGATVTISYDGKTDTLFGLPFPIFETNPVKFFNYLGANTVPATPGVQYTLRIVLPNNGGEISGQTTMLPKVPLDSVVVEWNPDNDTLARALTYITDDLSQNNYYRRLLNFSSLDSVPDQDFIVDDKLSTNETIAFGTGYDLLEGDTMFTAIYHIEKPYYDFLESVQLAIFANLNPFAQPSGIRSNVQGSANPIGIFTSLVYDRDTTIVQR